MKTFPSLLPTVRQGIANHIDNYQPPEPTASVQKK
ncbi:division septum protein Blr [Salmonella enterica]|nr:division septum protein Blr [Salmonella enterica]